jgi:hypothetical protein
MRTLDELGGRWHLRKHGKCVTSSGGRLSTESYFSVESACLVRRCVNAGKWLDQP